MSNLSARRWLTAVSALAALGADALPSIGTGNTARARPGRVVHSSGTFNAGRNAEKRKARAENRAMRKHLVDAYLAGNLPVRPAKRKYSPKLIEMLANRRLRQRGHA
jgi:hypothetical protein